MLCFALTSPAPTLATSPSALPRSATKPTKTPLFKRGTAHLRSPRRAQEMWGDGLSNLRFTATRYERDPRAGPYHKVTVSLDFDYRPVDLNGRQASDPEGFVPTFA